MIGKEVVLNISLDIENNLVPPNSVSFNNQSLNLQPFTIMWRDAREETPVLKAGNVERTIKKEVAPIALLKNVSREHII